MYQSKICYLSSIKQYMTKNIDFPVVENVFNEKSQKKTLPLSQIPRQCQIVIFSFWQIHYNILSKHNS